MSAAHTPGPWRVSELDSSGEVSEYHIFIEPDVAVIERKSVGHDSNEMPDARLIATAPLLLQELRCAVEMLRVLGVHDAATAGMRYAIKKATGSAA